MAKQTTKTAKPGVTGGLKRLNAVMSFALLSIVGGTALVVSILAARATNLKDAMSNQAASGTSSHAISFNLSGSNTFAAGEKIAVDFPQTSAFTQGGVWSAADFTFADGTARTIDAVNAGAGVTTVSCTDGVNNVGVAVDTTGLVFRVIPCGGSFTASAAGAFVTFTIDGAAPNGTLTNPSATGTYDINVADAAGDCSGSGESCQLAVTIITTSAVSVTATVPSAGGGGGGGGGGGTAPIITNINASNISETQEQIGWDTDQAATTRVNYGTTNSYGSQANDGAFVINHSIILSSLTGGTQYHYQVCSTNSGALQTCSPDQTFTTTDVTPPAISNVTVSAITQTTATVTWDTNENATSFVDWATIGGPPYANTTGTPTPLVTSHSVNLTGLTAGTTYHYRVRSGDASANEAFTSDATFTTTPPGGGPNITNVAVTAITASGATITWDTNVNATSFVDYATVAGPPYGSTVGTGTLVTSHSVALTGLTSGTVYHYSVRSADTFAQSASTADASFMTLDVTPPIISNVQATLITASTARITWDTDELSDSTVNYGPTITYGSTQASGTNVTSHQIDLTGLTPDTTYHFQVQSKDPSANLASAPDATFKTLKPAAPVVSNVQVTNITVSGARVTWDTTTVSDSTVDYGPTNTYGSTATDGTLVTSHLVVLSGLSQGTLYHFKVTSTDAIAQSGSSGDGTFTTLADTTPPANVTAFTATPGDSVVSLSWANPADPDFTGVKIMRKTTGFPTGPSDGTQVYDGSGTNTDDLGRTNGVTYYYAAFAHDGVPNYASGAVASATPIGPPDNTPPGNVTNLAAAPGDNQIQLTWTNPTDLDFAGVKVLRKDTGYPADPNDGTLVYDGTGTSRLDTGVLNGTLYYYTAFAYDGVPNYASGTQVSATPAAPPDTTPPANVTGLSAVAGDAVVQLTWTNPNTPDWAGTRIVRKVGGNPSGPNDGTIVADGIIDNALDTGLTNGTTYFYGAFPYDAVPNFASGAFANATPAANLPPPPAPACVDSDGGHNYDIAGTVTMNGSQNFPDTCTDPQTLTENYCENAVQHAEQHPCGDGFKCSAGACVPENFVQTEICGNGLCAGNENSLNCPQDCPIAPKVPPVPVLPPTVGADIKLHPEDLRFYATAGKIQLRIVGNRLQTYTRMAFTVMIPDPAIHKPIKSAYVTLAGSSYLMKKTASLEAVVSTPTDPGDQNMNVQVEYVDGTHDSVDLTIAVVRRGRVYETVNGADSMIEGARVTLYVQQGGGFGLWDGSGSNQQNPQETDSEGRFAYILPAGTYKLVAEKDGYYSKETLGFPFDKENVITTRLQLIKLPPKVKDLQTAAENAAFAAKVAADAVSEAANNPMVQEQTRTVAVPTAVAAALANVAAAGTATATAVPYLLYIYSFLSHPFQLIARRRRKKWGVVYNALTKLPIDLAIVRLLDGKTGRIIRSAVTDKDGRYFFIVQPGEYKITAVKAGYIFPTVYLKGQKEDAQFVDLYHGEAIAAKEETTITANIPLDPVETVKTPRKILLEGIGRRFQKSLGVISIVAMGVAAYVTPTPLVFAMLAGNIVMYFVFRRLAVPPRPKNWGIVYDEATKKPLQNTVARIFEARYNKLLETQVTDAKGRYAFLVGNNVYYVTFEKPGYQKQQKGPVDLTHVEKKKEGAQVVAVDVPLKKVEGGETAAPKKSVLPPPPPKAPIGTAPIGTAPAAAPKPSAIPPAPSAASVAAAPAAPPAPAKPAEPTVSYADRMLARLKAQQAAAGGKPAGEPPKPPAPPTPPPAAPPAAPAAPVAPTPAVPAAPAPKPSMPPVAPPAGSTQKSEKAAGDLLMIQDAQHAHPDEFKPPTPPAPPPPSMPPKPPAPPTPPVAPVQPPPPAAPSAPPPAAPAPKPSMPPQEPPKPAS